MIKEKGVDDDLLPLLLLLQHVAKKSYPSNLPEHNTISRYCCSFSALQ